MDLKLFMTKSKDGGLMWCGTSGKVKFVLFEIFTIVVKKISERSFTLRFDDCMSTF